METRSLGDIELGRIVESERPVVAAGQAVMVEADHAVDDRVWLEPAPGHTPGHVAIRIASKGEHAVMCGDLMHSPVQRVHPEWNASPDENAALAARTRRAFLEDCCEARRLVLTAHFPSPSIGHIAREGDAFRFRYEAWPA